MKAVVHAFGERAVLMLMYAALIRSAEWQDCEGDEVPLVGTRSTFHLNGSRVDFVGSGIETVILAGFARGMAQSGARRRGP